VDWSNAAEVARMISESTKLSNQDRNREVLKLASIISIESHCSRLDKLMEEFSEKLRKL